LLSPLIFVPDSTGFPGKKPVKPSFCRIVGRIAGKKQVSARCDFHICDFIRNFRAGVLRRGRFSVSGGWKKTGVPPGTPVDFDRSAAVYQR
jgi:hypothetical protein